MGIIRGKWWGSTSQPPILCLHGWQDNCGAFDRLIPFLTKDFSYLALDAPGHGRSEVKLIQFGTMDMLLFIDGVRRFYGWSKVNLIAHSMSGAVSFMYAAAFPELVNFVVFLESVRTVSEININYINMVVDGLNSEEERILATDEPPIYDFNGILKRIHLGAHEEIPLELCNYLVPRGVKESNKEPGKYYFARDPRLKYYNKFQFDQHSYLSFARDMTTPCLYLYGSGSFAADPENVQRIVTAELKRHNPNYEELMVPGHHHFLLTHPETCYKVINTFIHKWTSNRHKL